MKQSMTKEYSEYQWILGCFKVVGPPWHELGKTKLELVYMHPALEGCIMLCTYFFVVQTWNALLDMDQQRRLVFTHKNISLISNVNLICLLLKSFFCVHYGVGVDNGSVKRWKWNRPYLRTPKSNLAGSVGDILSLIFIQCLFNFHSV